MKKIRVAVVDDHRIIREGLVSIFKDNCDIEIIGDFDNGDALLNTMQPGQYDVVLLDMHMPQKGGIETVTEIVQKYPSTKVLMYTMSEIMDEIEQTVKIGAAGYILKSTGQEELEVAIKLVAHGNSYYNSSIISSFIKSSEMSTENLNALSKDEITILKLYCEEVPIKAVSSKMGITEQQVVDSIKQIKAVLRIKTDMGLAKFYVANYKLFSAYISNIFLFLCGIIWLAKTQNL